MAKVARQKASDPWDHYSAESITVLSGFDAVRKQPRLYVGNTADGSGLHQTVIGVVEHAIDEALSLPAPEVTITLNPDGSCSVRDNGRGLPTDILEGERVSAAEIIMTQIEDRPFAGPLSCPVFGGNLRSVGLSVVNALSTWLRLKIWRDGKEHFMEFREGEALAPLAVRAGAIGQRGMEVTFQPSPQVFTKAEFNCEMLARRLNTMTLGDEAVSFAALAHRRRALAKHPSGASIILHDMRSATKAREEIHYHG